MTSVLRASALAFAFSAVLGSGVCMAQAAQAPPARPRELVVDVVARFTPEQKSRFRDAGRSFGAKQYQAAYVTYKQLLADFPGDPILSKFASESALFAGDAAFALATIKPVAAADAEDWQAAALLTRACAETGDAAGRDAGIAHMQELKARRITPAGVERYLVERVKVDKNQLLIWMYLEPWGPYKVHAQGDVVNADQWTAQRITLESADFDQAPAAKTPPDGTAKAARRFSLDGYLDTGFNSAGQRTQTHSTYGFFDGQPAYSTLRERFIEVAAGKVQPISSRTGLIVK